jgi:hypothetical protein
MVSITDNISLPFAIMIAATAAKYNSNWLAKATAWAAGFGFQELEARPKPSSGRDFGPA